MANRSKSFTGRYDEQVAELTEIVAAQKGSKTESARLHRIALGFLKSVDDVATKRDTVHMSVNASDDGNRGRTYTVTLSHTPAPPIEADDVDDADPVPAAAAQ